jgi:hypothetical protein
MEPTRSRGIAAAIYGQILVTAVVAALSEDPAVGLGYLLLSTVTTVVVLWIAHVYSGMIARGIELQKRMGRAEIGAVVAAEWPMLETAIPTIVILLLGIIGVFSRNTTVTLAVGAGVITLCLWGLVFGRSAGESWPSAALSAAINGALGLVIVALKAIVH